MDKKIFKLIAYPVLICFAISCIYAETCPYDYDYKVVLKKALIDYLKAPAASTISLVDLKQMINFYLTKDTITDADCDAQLSRILSNADGNIPDDVLKALAKSGMPKCVACADGSLCGAQNAKGQNCACIDVDIDGKSEFCFLKPIIPQIKTCDACTGGTACNGKNANGQTCLCKDGNSDGKMEYCYLKSAAGGGGDICTNCCTQGQSGCTVQCQGGTNTMNCNPSISSCQYDGQTVTLKCGSNTQRSSCSNGRCGGSVTSQGPTTFVVTTVPSSPTTTVSGGGDICVNCCLQGQFGCSVQCQGGTNTMNCNPSISSCQYDGQTVTLQCGSNTQRSSCVGGRCGGSSPTTLSPTTFVVTTTLLSPTTTSPSGGDICTNCCLQGQTGCTVKCKNGSNTLRCSPSITSCQYNGQTLTLLCGTNTQESSCPIGSCP
jgi:hypothetical protein